MKKFIVFVSVLLTQLIFKEKLFSGVGISFKLNKWWLVAWLIMPFFCPAALFASALLPEVSITTESDFLQQSLSAI